jgi:hypothetical protein
VSYPGAGWAWDYKYYPSYLGDNHYTLLAFTSGSDRKICMKTEYRLYVHKNIDGSFVSTPFQLTAKPLMDGTDLLTQKFEKLFRMELREIEIDKILNE